MISLRSCSKALFLGSLVPLLLAHQTAAALLVVNTLDDELNNDGDCSLREAVQSRNTNLTIDQCGAGQIFDPSEIFIDLNGVIELDSPLEILQQVMIYGRGFNATTLSGQDSNRHFRLGIAGASQDFELRDITLANGHEAGDGGSILISQADNVIIDRVRFLSNQTVGGDTSGGAIGTRLANDNNTRLAITNSLFASNISSENGGAIAVRVSPSFGPPDSLVIQESSFSNNTAQGTRGGAVHSADVPIVVIEDSLFRNNSAGSVGGALWLGSSGASFTYNQLRNTTFLDNESGGIGGAIQTTNGTTVIRNSTFSGNEASNGAALHAGADAETAIFHSTFIDNGRASTSNGSVLRASVNAEISLSHSIVFSFDAAMDSECGDTGGGSSFVSLGHNIDASGSCTGHPSDIPMTDPQLAPLDDYGDDTNFLLLRTFLPLNGPAKDGGQNGPCPGGAGATLLDDQRGRSRPTSAGANRCDIGAVEVQSGSDPTGFPFAVSINRGSGTVISSPGGIDCPGDCVGQFLEDSTVTLTAIPAPGFVLTDWGGECAGKTPICQFTITGAGSASAVFDPTSDEIFSDRFEN